MIPATLRVILPDLKYNIIVGLSTSTQCGRVILVMDRSFCSDSAGNRFQRTGNSSDNIHYDGRSVFANLWTAIPDIQLVCKWSKQKDGDSIIQVQKMEAIETVLEHPQARDNSQRPKATEGFTEA